jgi:hypothetical protein
MAVAFAGRGSDTERMSNIHRFKPRPKVPPPRRGLPCARSGWLPWVLVLAGAAAAALLGLDSSGTGLVELAVVLAGAWLHQRA